MTAVKLFNLGKGEYVRQDIEVEDLAEVLICDVYTQDEEDDDLDNS